MFDNSLQCSTLFRMVKHLAIIQNSEFNEGKQKILKKKFINLLLKVQGSLVGSN